MSSFKFLALSTELQLIVLQKAFANHFDILDLKEHENISVEPPILQPCRVVRRDGLGEYRAYLQSEQEVWDGVINDPMLAYVFRFLPAARIPFRTPAASWSAIRMERERLRYLESGYVAQRGNKGNGRDRAALE